MSWRVTRLRLAQIGPRTARYNTMVDLRDRDERAASAAALRLVNRGGKGVLLQHIFNVLVPGDDGIIGEDDRRGGWEKLGAFVLGKDVAHLAIEWRRGDELLVTGKMMQWRYGHPTRNRRDLITEYYLFAPGALTIETLPFERDGKWLPRDKFRDSLRDTLTVHGHRDPGLVVTDVQRDWTRALNSRGLDSELFRLQARMNDGEGDADLLIRSLRKNEDFLKFFIDMQADDDEIDTLQETVIAQRQALAKRDLVLAEVELFDRLARGAKPLVSLAEEQRRTDALALEAEVAGQDLGLRLQRTKEIAEEKLPALEEEHAAAGTRATNARNRQGIATLQQHSAALRAAEFDAAARELEAKEADQKADDARTTAIAWQTAPNVARQRRLEAQRRGIEQRMAAADLAAEPFRQAAATSAGILRSALRAAQAEHRGSVGKLGARIAQVENICDGAKREVLEAVNETGRLEGRLIQARADRARLARRLQGLVRDGILPDKLTAAAQIAALDVSDRQVTKKLEELRDEIADAEGVAARAEEASKKATAAVDLVSADARAAAAAESVVKAQVQTVLDREELAAVLDAELSTLDLWADVTHVSARVRDHVTTAKAREAELLADEHARRVVLERIGRTRFLPADDDCERVIQALAERKIAAVSGWRQIHDNLGSEQWNEAVERAGPLAGSVVLTGVGSDASSAVASMREQPMRLRRSVAVLTSVEFQRLIDGGGSTELTPAFASIPGAPGLFDPAAAERESKSLQVDLSGADEQRAALENAVQAAVELDLAVRELFEEHAVDPRQAAAERARQSMNALRHAQQAVQDTEAASVDAATRLRGLAERASRLEQTRVATSRARERLTDIVEDEQRLATPEHDPAVISSELERVLAARVTAEQKERQAAERLGAAKAERASLLVAIEELAAEDGRMAIEPEGEAEAGAVLDLEAARASYETAVAAWTAKVADDALQEEHRRISVAIEDVARDISRVEPSAREEAAALLDSGLATERTFGVGARESEALRQQATRASGAAHERLEAAGRAVKEAASTLDRHVQAQRQSRQASRLTEELDPRPAGMEEAREMVSQFGREAAAALSDYNNANSDEARLRGAITDIKKLARTCDQLRRGLPQHPDPTLKVDPLDSGIDDLEELAGEVRQRVDTAREAADSVRERRVEHATQVRAIAASDWPEEAGDILRRQIGATRDIELADLCALRHQDFVARHVAATTELARLDERTSATVELFAKQLRAILRLLRLLARVSRMPSGLGQWSGKPFVQAAVDTLPEDGILRARANDVLSDALRQDRPVKGRDLLFRGVIAVCGGKAPRIRFLRPDIGLPYEPVDLGTGMSGGQGVTAGVALYCTLANLRRSERAVGTRADSGGGTLLLDNPFGKTTSNELLEVMFRVADGLGVQIIALTPSTEDQVARQFPVLVQLRNSRGMKAGLRHVRVSDVRYRDQLAAEVAEEDITGARLLVQEE